MNEIINCPICSLEAIYKELINRGGWFVKKYYCPDCKRIFYIDINKAETEEFNG